jgi:hypothetical protein
MGVQFWWFYDVIAVAVILVSIFLSVRKGLIKAIASLMGFVMSAVIAFSAGGPIANLMYEQSEKSSNIKKFDLSLENRDFIADLGSYLETLGYDIRVDNGELRNAFYNEDEPEKRIYKYINNINNKKVDEESIFINKLHEGYAVVINNYVSKRMNAYSAEYAAEEMRKHPEKAFEFSKLLDDLDTKRPAAQYLTDNFLKKPYITQTKLLAMVLIFAVGAIITVAISIYVGRKHGPMGGLVEGVISGILGIAVSVTIIIFIALMIRLYVVMGNDKMLFFNHEAIDNTYVFKYFYEFISGL